MWCDQPVTIVAKDPLLLVCIVEEFTTRTWRSSQREARKGGDVWEPRSEFAAVDRFKKNGVCTCAAQMSTHVAGRGRPPMRVVVDAV